VANGKTGPGGPADDGGESAGIRGAQIVSVTETENADRQGTTVGGP